MKGDVAMHRVFRMMIFLCGLALVNGCAFDWNRKREPSGPSPVGSLSEARTVAERFLAARVAGVESEELKTYFSPRGWESLTEGRTGRALESGERPLTGYSVGRAAIRPENKFVVETAVQSVYTGQPTAQNIRESLVLVYQDGRYLIDSVLEIRQTVLFARNRQLVIRNEQGERPVLSLSQLPQELSPQGAGPEVRFGFGRDRFVAAAVSPDDQRIAYGTAGTHGGLGWADLSQTPARNYPLDLIFEGSATLLVFSPTGRYLAAQYLSATGNQGLRIYQPEQNRWLDFKLGAQFPPEQYSLVLRNWEEDGSSLLFRVNPGAGVTAPDAAKLGDWELDVIGGTLNRSLNR